MLELCFLMFVIGCGYILYSSLIRFFTPHKNLPIQIPSIQHLNLVWGFVFYGFALSLLSHSVLFRVTDCILSLVLMAYAIYLSCYRHFFCGGFCPINKVIKYFISKRLKDNPLISKENAGKALGLSAFELNNQQLIEIQHQKIIFTLQKRNFLLPELKKIINSARKILS